VDFMRASRLLSMLITLQVRGRVTAHALAEEFEVSVRTIYRDIDELSAAGVPVYADRGPGGGFQLLEGYRTRLTGLSAPEAEALLLMGLPGPADDLGLAEPAAAARMKLLAALPAAAGAGALKVADRFHLDPLEWFRRASPPPNLAAAAQAVWQGRRIEIGYESWKATVRRRLDPLGLVVKAGAWYLVARYGPQPRTYRLSNVLDITVLDETFERPDGFDLPRHWRAEVQRFEADLRRDVAVVRVHERALSRLDRLGADFSEPVRAAIPDARGWREAEVPIESPGHAAGLLLGFGDAIEVVSPPALRRELVRLAAEVSGLYSSDRL
jgi:predicted DNA-binding transcriptional regulator YafY